MAKPWDDSMKMLVRANPQALVSLLLPGAKFQGEQDKELKARTVEADLLYNVIWRGRKIILHVEFQLCAANTNLPSGMQHPLSINHAERSFKLPCTFERRLV